MDGLRIERMQAEDWRAVRAIYLGGMHGGNATFETVAPSWEKWNAAHHQHSRIILGWAALRPVSDRKVYTGVAEVSVYVSAKAQRQGVGRALLDALIESSERNDIWTLNAGIFPENNASIGLHSSCGFRTVGRREKIGKLGNHWRDVMLLERRSKLTGL